MSLDLEKYRPFLDRFDMSDNQKTEYLHVLHCIAETFVELALSGVPKALACGDNADIIDAHSPLSAIELKPVISAAFKQVAGNALHRKEPS